MTSLRNVLLKKKIIYLGSDIFEIQKKKKKNWLYFLKLMIFVIHCGSVLNFTVLIKKWFYLSFVLRGAGELLEALAGTGQ